MPRRASLPGADLLFGSPASPPVKDRTAHEPASGPPGTLPGPVPPDASPPLPSKHSPPVPSPPGLVDRGGEPASGQVVPSSPGARAQPPRPRASGGQASRPRHEQKITFYCTDSDLTRLEAARLSLRADHRLASDRGRIVRAAIAEMLDDFDARGAESSLVKRLSSE